MQEAAWAVGFVQPAGVEVVQISDEVATYAQSYAKPAVGKYQETG